MNVRMITGTRYHVQSKDGRKTAEITIRRNCNPAGPQAKTFEIRYDHNGSVKNCANYQAAVNHLVGRGW